MSEAINVKLSKDEWRLVAGSILSDRARLLVKYGNSEGMKPLRNALLKLQETIEEQSGCLE